MTHPRDFLPYVDPSKPQGPKNLVVYTPFLRDVLDLQWDDASLLSHNMSNFSLVGYNVYRSQTESGTYTKINDELVVSTSYRDIFKPVLITEEDVSSNFIRRGNGPGEEWFFCVSRSPIVDPATGDYTRNPLHVVVEIDNEIVPVRRVVGSAGEIYLHHEPYVDFECGNRPKNPTLPTNDSVIKATYYTRPDVSSPRLGRRLFYKVTAVDDEGNETPLSQMAPSTYQNTETLGYIWTEAVRRNKWILEQGGEEVFVFIRKTMGDRCTSCFDNPEVQETHRQPRNNCESCFGTGFVGGYIGPIPILIAPRQDEQNIELGPQGLHLNFVWSTWTTNWPLLRQRDFIRTRSGELLALGPVTPIQHRGLTLQQHFSVSHVDSTDIRYRVPIDGYVPLITDKTTIDDAIEIRGRSLVFENHHY